MFLAAYTRDNCVLSILLAVMRRTRINAAGDPLISQNCKDYSMIVMTKIQKTAKWKKGIGLGAAQ